MKRLLYLVLISFLFILSCEKDDFPACNCEGSSTDKICSQYLFENNISLGYINFEYDNNNRLVKKSYFNNNNGVKKISYFEYANNKLTKETVYKSINSIDYIRLYNYNSYDSISSVICYRDSVEFSKITYDYNDARKKLLEKQYSNDNLITKNTYEYNTDGVLLKIKTFDSNDSLQSLKMYSFFLDNITKITNYGSEYNYLGNDVFKYDDKNQIINAYHYGPSYNLINYEIGEFENSLLSKKTIYNNEDKPVSYNVYKYY
jgi:hypothetical protein